MLWQAKVDAGQKSEAEVGSQRSEVRDRDQTALNPKRTT